MNILTETKDSFVFLMKDVYKRDFREAKTDFLDLIYYNLYYNIISKIETIRNFFFWGWKLRNSFDFDCNSLYELIYLKLDTSYKYFRKHGHTVWSASDTNSMKKLREAIGLAKKLNKGESDKYIYKFFNKYKRPKKDESDLDRMMDSRRKDMNRKELNIKMYGFYFKKASKRDSNLEKYRKERLFYILNKYINSWWD